MNYAEFLWHKRKTPLIHSGAKKFHGTTLMMRSAHRSVHPVTGMGRSGLPGRQTEWLKGAWVMELPPSSIRFGPGCPVSFRYRLFIVIILSSFAPLSRGNFQKTRDSIFTRSIL